MSNAPPLLALVHGWGADASCWAPLRAALPEADFVALDLGFFTAGPAADRRQASSGDAQSLAGEDVVADPRLRAGTAVVAVAHSLGLLWLLRHRPFRWRALVSIAGVSRFTRADGFDAGVPTRVLERMIARVRREPEATLEDFWARAGAPPPGLPRNWSGCDRDRLAEGLSWLGAWDGRAALAEDAVPALALAARDDAIIAPLLTEACFARRPQTRIAFSDDGGGHALPWSRASWCADEIRSFLEREEARP